MLLLFADDIVLCSFNYKFITAVQCPLTNNKKIITIKCYLFNGELNFYLINELLVIKCDLCMGSAHLKGRYH